MYYTTYTIEILRPIRLYSNSLIQHLWPDNHPLDLSSHFQNFRGAEYYCWGTYCQKKKKLRTQNLGVKCVLENAFRSLKKYTHLFVGWFESATLNACHYFYSRHSRLKKLSEINEVIPFENFTPGFHPICCLRYSWHKRRPTCSHFSLSLPSCSARLTVSFFF